MTGDLKFLPLTFSLTKLHGRVTLLDATKGRIERPAALVASLIPKFTVTVNQHHRCQQ